MSTIQEFEEAAAKATQASAQAETWAKGPINTTVPTDSGPVPTIAEFTRAAQVRADAAIEALGWVLAGDFTTGCTVTDRNQYVLVVGGAGYRWDGALPKVVAPGSTPTPIEPGAWVLVGDATLRGDLAAAGGAGLVGGLAKPVTWSGFAGGADPTGATASDAAFAPAAAYAGDVYVPAGKYNITNIYRGNFICEDGVEFVGAGYVMANPRSLWPAVNAASVMTRLNRLAIGDTAVDLGPAKASTQVSWLGKKTYTAPNGTLQPNLGWIEQNARGTSYASQGAIGFAGAAHTEQLQGGAAIGIVGAAVNDNETTSVNAWAGYLDAKRYPLSGTTWGAEIAVANHGSYVDMHSSSVGKTYGAALVAGADPTINGFTDDCTVALAVNSNGAKWGVGVAFNSALRTFDTESWVDPYQKALVLRNSNRIGWESSSGETLNYIVGKTSDPLQRTGISLRGGVIDFDGPNFRMFRISSSDNDKGTFRVFTASETNPVLRLATEGVSNCSLQLESTGSGNVIVKGSLRPAAANGSNCGTSSFPWAGGFTQTAFTVTSDENYKTKPFDITDAMLNAAAEVDWCMFQYLDRVEAKGEDLARWHFGAMAQRFVEAFERHGLNAHDYAFICYDEWGDSPEVVDDCGEVISPAVEAGSRYGIRYDQAIILKQKQIERDHKRQLDALESRIAALEAK